MAIDPYDLCPCYSGKKVKFCCLPVVDEMEKAATQINQKNFRSAIKICQQAEKKHPGHPWPLILQTFALQQENNLNDAYEIIKNSVMNMQDHPGVFSMFTSIHLHKMGYKESRKLVDRAIQLALKHPEPMHVLPLIYNPLSMAINEEEHLLSARYFLSVDISSCNPEIQQYLMQELFNLDHHLDYPLNMRGPQFLKNWQAADQESQQLFDRFMQTAGYGMLERSQSMLQKLIDKFPQEADLWWNLGLIQAWDHRENEALVSLQKAGTLFTDEHAAIEAFALMIAIKWFSQANVGSQYSKVYRVTSLSKLLTLLDGASRFLKNPKEQNEHEDEVEMYWVLNREFGAEALPPNPTWRDYPMSLGQVHIASEKNQTGEGQINCWLICEDNETLVQLDHQLQLVASEVLDSSESNQQLANKLPVYNMRYVNDLRPVWSHRVFGLGVNNQVNAQLILEEMIDRISQDWVHHPLEVLGGKSVIEGAREPDLSRLCRAVLFVLEVILSINEELLDKVYQQLEIGRLPLIKLDQLSDPTRITNYQLVHLDFNGLDLETLKLINERLQILQYHSTGIRVLREIYKLPNVDQETKLTSALGITKLFIKLHQMDQAKSWITDSEVLLKEMDLTMETRMKYEFMLLSHYVGAHDSRFMQKIKEFRNKYEAKFPKVREILQQIIESVGETMGEVVMEESSSEQNNSLWTPEQSVPAAASAGGLWIPGS